MKTRLLPRLSPEQAAGLHSAFVLDTIEKARRIKGVDVELHTDVTWTEWAAPDLPCRLQYPGGLGTRMLDSLRDALDEDRPRALILGTDWGRQKMAASTASPPLALMKRCSMAYPGALLKTFSRTVEAIRACGLTLTLASPWYDVDEPADLSRLELEPRLPRHTSGWLHKYRAQHVPGVVQ